jgi:pyruvate-ferredoxin/flavodoxin oxidoreductase
VSQAHFVACHQFGFLQKIDMLAVARPGATFLLNAPHAPDRVWDHLPAEVQRQILHKHLKLFVIDAYRVARDTGMGGRINTIMQTCFFALSGVLPREEAIGHIKHAIEKSYRSKGAEVVAKNFQAVDETLAHLYPVDVQRHVTGMRMPPTVPVEAPDFVQRVTAAMLAGHGDLLPVSAFPVDGTWPLGTAKWEKRAIATEIPIWEADLCIQCNKCAEICPHAAIRVKHYPAQGLDGAPQGFRAMAFKSPDFLDHRYTVQVAPEDCTGCHLCVEICPAVAKDEPKRKALAMEPMAPHREVEKAGFEFFQQLPQADRTRVKLDVKGVQFLEPLFEFSGACAGCGETPYVKLLTQLYGDRLLIANATGCSSIFGGNLPTTPYTCNSEGRGPAWANSLFEDNAEFGYGMRLAVDKMAEHARELVMILGVGDQLADGLLQADQSTEVGIAAQRERVLALRKVLAGNGSSQARWLEGIADYLVKKSVWIVGGDGWAYDIGYGGLDHVIAMNRDVNILVMDTEVYSNTGGQASKATPMAAAARFAMAGKASPKKDLALLAMTYGHAYVARVAIGAKDAQTVNAIKEAESFTGTSLVLAYSHCIAHGYELGEALQHQERAVASAYWPLFRFDPRRWEKGESPLKLDSQAARLPLGEFLKHENRFRQVQQADPARFARLVAASEVALHDRYALYEHLAKAMTPPALATKVTP